MWDEDPLPDGIPLFEASSKLAGRGEAAVRELFGAAALLVQSSDLRRPMVLAPTQGELPSEPTQEVRVLLLPLKKRPDRNAFPHISVGRTRNNDVVLMDATVSKFHAFFREQGACHVLADGGSRNGTFVDATPVAARGTGPPHALTMRLSLRFGSVTATYLPFDELCQQLRRVAG